MDHSLFEAIAYLEEYSKRGHTWDWSTAKAKWRALSQAAKDHVTNAAKKVDCERAY